MVDLQALRQTISATPSTDVAAIVTRGWLQEVERDLSELAMRRAKARRK